MKKIILAFDSTNFSEGAFEFARQLNLLHPILLSGIFLPQAAISNLWSYADVGGGPLVPLVEPADATIIKKNIAHFEQLCQQNNIEYRVHKDYFDMVLPQLKKESRYADLLILGSEVFYETIGAHLPNQYLEDAIHDVRCAVLLVPEKYEFPQSIILAYDGSEESVFAIKQFAYLFPELSQKEAVLVYASEKKEEDFPDKVQIEELVASHFSNLTLTKLAINPAKHFCTWVSDKKSALLVSGSYGRSGLSQLFKKSFVKEVIAAHRVPVFIAHK
jgi:nucleotide-binding universal stress UspA family protein